MNKRAILCVDDEVIVLDALKEQIQNSIDEDFMIEIAESGQEAMEVFDELLEDGYDVPVVIADYIMPEMTGDAVLEYVFSKNPDTRTILLTGQASLQGVENAVNKANLYRFISKPWDKEDLILTLKEAIRSYKQDRTIDTQNKALLELNANLEKKVEERTKQLQELNATKDKFFSIIAHDLKNPFNTLLGFSELLTTNITRYSEKEIKEFIDIIYQTSKNGFALLENLLQWSRSQTGKINFSPTDIDLKNVVENNVFMLDSIAKKKDITLKSTLSEDIQAVADENMVNTILRNIISNAIKFTKNGGEVVVSANVEKAKMITLSITDNGVGIKQNDIEKLFKIDANHSTVGTENEMGTGLGLILCKEFVKKHNGQIWVESEVNKGTTFSFTLPIK